MFYSIFLCLPPTQFYSLFHYTSLLSILLVYSFFLFVSHSIFLPLFLSQYLISYFTLSFSLCLYASHTLSLLSYFILFSPFLCPFTLLFYSVSCSLYILITKQEQGQALLDIVFEHLQLTERDYFGLQLTDETSENQRWLDPNKPIRKQLKRVAPNNLSFRVKFFVSEPSKLQEEYTRYLYFLQLKQDILSGRLPCPQNAAALLASYAIQAELGDYSQSEHLPGYLSEFSFIPNPPEDFEKEVAKLHQQHNGLSPAQAEFNYLSAASSLDLYGVELHYARSKSRESLLGFSMMNYRACKNVWKACVEHHTFFRLERPAPQQKSFFAHYFTLGSKFRYCKPLVRRLVSGMDWETVSRNSLSDDRLETQSLPNRSPPAVPHDNLVLIKMKPDENGRFGFNVKGGADQRMPIIVSRVAPGTAADLCVPRLNEGDQVVLINGRDISDYTHDDVVMLIKASCENQSAELILLVRPNAIYDVDEEDEKLDLESEFHYIPESCGLDRSHSEPDGWKSSFQLLRDGLSSGSVLAQFDQLYRKRPGMSMSCARLPQNVSKNRYRDISPYDTTRVVLKGTEDYINIFSYLQDGGGGVRRYIACQGPLPGTCGDFWQMVWEQSATLVVMLTTQVERGRVKCHQYWPNVSATGTYGGFQVTCISEDGNSAYLLRALTLTHLESKEERQLCQMQYMAWPDHGVPDDSTDFLNFVSLVRSKRGDSQEAVVVHCSAGIGRTGVLITMETAMCLIERSQSVYPLDIVRTMRDQRAMMIQTPVSEKPGPGRDPESSDSKDLI
uniref:protein-tyrosine-phosphatase n=1 Tax=Astyanax mexicanus TaxID=7994 RepID=A0A8B9LII9_ASTMX